MLLLNITDKEEEEEGEEPSLQLLTSKNILIVI